jgi:signal peptidase I
VVRPRFILWRDQDRPYLKLLLALAVAFASVVVIFYIVFTSVRVEGESMFPALFPDDHVLVTRGYESPRVGDVVSAYVTTELGREGVIKRVVALPGDTVEVRGDTVYVNGTLSEAAPEPILATDVPVLDPLVVPEGHVYLLGDNRPVSYDSRFLGPVPLPDIAGRVVVVFSPVTRWRIVD